MAINRREKMEKDVIGHRISGSEDFPGPRSLPDGPERSKKENGRAGLSSTRDTLWNEAGKTLEMEVYKFFIDQCFAYANPSH